MVMDVDQTCDHFTMYTNTETLNYTPDTNIMLYVN